jgi:protocatechuate 3,4-dioxygenase beta subunit
MARKSVPSSVDSSPESQDSWTRTESGLLVPGGLSRRLILAGGTASAASLLLACSGGEGGGTLGGDGTGTAPSRGTGGRTGSATGGSSGSASPGTGGAGAGGAGGGTPAGSGGSSAQGSGGAGPSGSGGAAGGTDASAPDTGSVEVMDSGAPPSTPANPSAEVPSPPKQPGMCVVRPSQIEGPFPTRMKVERVDIRSEPGSMIKLPGVPLRVVMRVSQMGAMGCNPLQGAVVDFWQCDAKGVYSAYGSQGTAGKNYLRGYQVADSTGTVEFLTIYPGAYSGRAVHVHFNVRSAMGAGARSFTSQIYFPEDVNDQIFGKASGYASRRVMNAADSFYRDGGNNLIFKMSKSGAGWLGEFDLAMR